MTRCWRSLRRLREPQKLSRQTSTAAAPDQVIERAGNSLREKEGQVREKAAIAAGQVVEEEKRAEVVKQEVVKQEVVKKHEVVTKVMEVVKEQEEVVAKKQEVVYKQKELAKEKEAVKESKVLKEDEAETEECSENKDEAYFNKKSFARK